MLLDNCLETFRHSYLAIWPSRFQRQLVVSTGAPTPASTVQVKSATLYEIFKQTRIDFLKKHVRGWEAAVLARGRKVWPKNIDIILFLEFWPFGLRGSGTDPDQLRSYLTELGFNMCNVGRGRLVSLQGVSLPDPAKEFAYSNLVAFQDPQRFKELLD